MFHATDEVRGKVLEIIEGQLLEEIEAALLARRRKEIHQFDGQPAATRKLVNALAIAPSRVLRSWVSQIWLVKSNSVYIRR